MIWRVRDRATWRQLARAERRRRGPVSLARVRDPEREARGEPPRVAFGIGRRVGNAVTRNRLRRRSREAMRRQTPRLRPGAAYLVGAGRPAAEWPVGELEAVLGSLAEELEAARR